MKLCPIGLKTHHVFNGEKGCKEDPRYFWGGGKDVWAEAASFQMETLVGFWFFFWLSLELLQQSLSCCEFCAVLLCRLTKSEECHWHPHTAPLTWFHLYYRTESFWPPPVLAPWRWRCWSPEGFFPSHRSPVRRGARKAWQWVRIFSVPSLPAAGAAVSKRDGMLPMPA